MLCSYEENTGLSTDVKELWFPDSSSAVTAASDSSMVMLEKVDQALLVFTAAIQFWLAVSWGFVLFS